MSDNLKLTKTEILSQIVILEMMSRLLQCPQLFLLCCCFVVLSFLLRGATVSADGIITDCLDRTNFTANSTFEKNLNLLFSTLSSRANTSTTIGAFSNATIGTETTDPVYGIFVCRGDATPAVCGDCVATAISSLRSLCTHLKSAMNGYDNCMFRYSGNLFFGQVDTGMEVFTINNPNVTSNVTGFNDVLGDTLNTVASEASLGGTTLKYATVQAKFSPFDTVYALGQCTPDLSKMDCYNCLKKCVSAMPDCCGNKQSAWVLYPSCNLRYDNYMFYQTVSVAPPPSPSRSKGGTNPLEPTPSDGTSNSTSGGNRKKLSAEAVIGVAVGSALVGVVLVAIVICLISKEKRNPISVETAVSNRSDTDDFTTAESLLYDFDTLQAATNNFSRDNKLGEGGFGAVYKGVMPDGQDIAVKRLTRSSHQGVQQFKNEAVLVAKLQHRNLVRLLGFCLARNEKLLVYEYVPNKSLDYFIFDAARLGQLDWSRRYKIIVGIARGMLYLHEDSQLRIIHRDLKAGNILLDADMNPKIADFGTARIFGVDQTRDNTDRVVGTYGYMSPEYVMHGHFSVKSDVYSFGVLVLEIISGKKNSNFYISGNVEHLMSYAWKVWKEGKPMEFVDPSIKNSCPAEDVTRCIHIGLSCVQDDMDARPSMASVMLMLNNYSSVLPAPRRPAFIMHPESGSVFSSDKPKSESLPWSVNEVTITDAEPR